MSFSFRPALRENVGLLIGLAGPTGSGKTYSALRLAKGLVGDQRFAVVDTEHGRSKIYADEFSFDRADLDEPFSPGRYAEAISDALKAGYPTVVVDSMSHEYSGEGGIVDWHDKEVEEMVKRALTRQGENRSDWQLRESYNWPAWKAPKQSHKRDLLAKLIAMPPNRHLILCFRAEPKSALVEEKESRRKKIVPMEGATGLDGWFPITEKHLPYELTVSHLMLAEKPGYPRYIKCPEKLRAFFPTDKPIDEESGRALAEWARGGAMGVLITAEKPSATNATVHALASPGPTTRHAAVMAEIRQHLETVPKDARAGVCKEVFGSEIWNVVARLPLETLEAAIVPATGGDIGKLEAAIIMAKERAS